MIEDRVECRVHAPSVKIEYINHNSVWVNTLSEMGLWETIPGGSAIVAKMASHAIFQYNVLVIDIDNTTLGLI